MFDYALSDTFLILLKTPYWSIYVSIRIFWFYNSQLIYIEL